MCVPARAVFLPVVGDAAVTAAVQETVSQLCLVALAVVGFEWCFVWVVFGVAVHGLAADVAGGAVFEVVEELLATSLVVVAVATLGGASHHVCSFPFLFVSCPGRESVSCTRGLNFSW